MRLYLGCSITDIRPGWQWVCGHWWDCWKVLRHIYSAYRKSSSYPFIFFHILLCCVMLNCFKLLCLHFTWRGVHKTDMTSSSSVRLAGDHRWTAIYRFLQRCLIGSKSQLWLDHSRAFIESSLSHSCIVLAVCVGWLSCWKVKLSAQSEVLSALNEVFIKDISVFSYIQLSVFSDHFPSPCRWKTPPQHDASATMLHRWDGIMQVISGAWFPSDMNKELRLDLGRVLIVSNFIH